MFFPSSIDFLADNNFKWDFNLNPNISQDAFDFESAALHEIGHAMGLNHTCNEKNVMFPSQGLEEEIRDLDPDDLEGGTYCQSRSIEPLHPDCRLPLLTLEGEVLLNTVQSTNSYSPFIVAPNPVLDRLLIENSEGLEYSKLTIYSLAGDMVKQYNSISNSEEINLAELTKRLYLISIETKTKTFTHKIIKL